MMESNNINANLSIAWCKYENLILEKTMNKTRMATSICSKDKKLWIYKNEL